MTALLAARELSARRGERLLFGKLELALQAGEVVWLRGTNGRGKTTPLRLLAGLATP
jgi:heme exporter protein A